MRLVLSHFQTNRIRLYVLPDPHAVHSGLAGSTEIKASLEIVADEELDNVTLPRSWPLCR